jgi:hypothetical protein
MFLNKTRSSFKRNLFQVSGNVLVLSLSDFFILILSVGLIPGVLLPTPGPEFS